MFHKEGHKIILISLLITVSGILLIDHFLIDLYILKTVLQVALLVFLVLILQFFKTLKEILS